MTSQLHDVAELGASGSHFFRLYEPDDASFIDSVTAYVAHGLRQNDAVIVVASKEHVAALTAHLKIASFDVTRALEDRQLQFMDAGETLARLMVDGYPDNSRFDRIVGNAVRGAVSDSRAAVRIFGEMVGLLWQSNQIPAAVRLEQLWNALRSEISFTLYCAYPIDIFAKDFRAHSVDALLCAHQHLLPAATNDRLTDALERAIVEASSLDGRQARASAKISERADWGSLPSAESLILWLRSNRPLEADAILAQAKSYYQGPISGEATA